MTNNNQNTIQVLFQELSQKCFVSISDQGTSLDKTSYEKMAYSALIVIECILADFFFIRVILHYIKKMH